MPGEFDLIERYFAPLAGPAGLGLKDDVAVLKPPPGKELLITKDLILESVHFRPDDPPETIAFKALAVNVSDCVAKGGDPKLYWLGLALPQSTDDQWLHAFSKGLQEAQDRFGCVIAGGDTTRSKTGLMVSLTLVGECLENGTVLRSGASAGDEVYVTGTLGDAALGFCCLQQGVEGYASLVSAYRRPVPPHTFGPRLTGLATASADISDGLIADARHIADTSGVQVVLYEDRLPISEEARRFLEDHPEHEEKVWSGGDDYQILFTASGKDRKAIAALAEATNIPVTRIGSVHKGQDVQLLDKSGQIVQVTYGGYRHF